MHLNKALSRVAVLGAAGKMGCGIALILLQEMARLEADEAGHVDGNNRKLILIDINEEALPGLRHYLQKHLLKYAEKNINLLRHYYATNISLVSNEEIIASFVDGALDMCLFESDIRIANEAIVIFEAVVEDVELKVNLLKYFKDNSNQFIFSNTSSIPINVLRKKTGMDGNLIGVHFYNPPAVQKLIELITPAGTRPEAKQLALDLAASLKKIVVESADVAGFIGNGHFAREVVFSCRQTAQLAKNIPLEEAVYLINRVSGEYLVRPMGIFQLIDYVGVNVVHSILHTMQTYQHEKLFHDNLIDRMLEAGALGGISSDGMMKNGFFQYENNKPVGVFSLETKNYRPFDGWSENIKRALGALPENYSSWKQLANDPERQRKIESYFTRLFESGASGAEIAFDYLIMSRDIQMELVRDGVARNKEDVNKVLINGFYHLYDADIPWFNFEHIFRSNICE